MLDPIKKAELHVSGGRIPNRGASKKEKKESKTANICMKLITTSKKSFFGSIHHPNEIAKSLEKELPSFLSHLNARLPRI